MSADTTITIDAADAVELVEALEWLRDWFAEDHDRLAASMHRHSFGLFHLDELDDTLDRFARLLGGRP